MTTFNIFYFNDWTFVGLVRLANLGVFRFSAKRNLNAINILESGQVELLHEWLWWKG